MRKSFVQAVSRRSPITAGRSDAGEDLSCGASIEAALPSWVRKHEPHTSKKPRPEFGARQKKKGEDHYPDIPICEPLTLEQAARVVGLKMKNARFIFASQPFLKAYSANLMAIHNGHKARAVAVLAEVMNTAGDSLASDRAVRIKAASQLLNDGDGRSGSQVNLQINNGGPALAPGIVIRLPASPLELQQECLIQEF